MHKLLTISALLISIHSTSAQELNCRVTVDAELISLSDRQLFKDMERTFTEFMNTTRWTDDVFEYNERIDCEIYLTLTTMPSAGQFTGTAQVRSSRPAYGTDYATILLNFPDKEWTFEYNYSQPLNFNINTFSNNVTSLMAYYAYIIIGMDYDSFSPLSGTKFYENANNIAALARQSSSPGWELYSSSRRNRYALVQNLIDPQLEPFRKALYTYHRVMLDDYAEDPDAAAETVLAVLIDFKKINDVKPSSVLLTTYISAKTTELLNIFSNASTQQKQQAYNLLTAVDPTKTDAFRQLTNR